MGQEEPSRDTITARWSQAQCTDERKRAVGRFRMDSTSPCKRVYVCICVLTAGPRGECSSMPRTICYHGHQKRTQAVSLRTGRRSPRKHGRAAPCLQGWGTVSSAPALGGRNVARPHHTFAAQNYLRWAAAAVWPHDEPECR